MRSSLARAVCLFVAFGGVVACSTSADPPASWTWGESAQASPAPSGFHVDRYVYGSDKVLVAFDDQNHMISQFDMTIDGPSSVVHTAVFNGGTWIQTNRTDQQSKQFTNSIQSPDGVTTTWSGTLDQLDHPPADYTAVSQRFVGVMHQWQDALNDPLLANHFNGPHPDETPHPAPSPGLHPDLGTCDYVCAALAFGVCATVCSPTAETCAFLCGVAGATTVCGEACDNSGSGDSEQCTYTSDGCCQTCCEDIWGCETSCPNAPYEPECW